MRKFSQTQMNYYSLKPRMDNKIPIILDLNRNESYSTEEIADLARSNQNKPKIILRHASGFHQILHLDQDGISKDNQQIQSILTKSIRVSGNNIVKLIKDQAHLKKTITVI